jgi:hypothetical protein
VYTVICVQYQAGATAAQARYDKEISMSNIINIEAPSQIFDTCLHIEGVFFNMDISLILRHVYIQVLNFCIDVSSMSYSFNITVLKFNIKVSQNVWICGQVGRALASDVLCCGFDPCRRCPQGVAVDFGPKQSGQLINQLGNPSFRPSISKVENFNIEVQYCTRYRSTFSELQYQNFQVPTSIKGYQDIEGQTFNTKGRQGTRCSNDDQEESLQKGLSFISNCQRWKECMFCVSELAGIEPTPAQSRRTGCAHLNLSATV